MKGISQRDDRIHLSPFHPMLEFPRRISGISADLESCQDYNLYFQWVIGSGWFVGQIISFAG